MSVTSPDSEFSLIKSAGAGIIYWGDGHSISGETIEAAIDAGMKHFRDVNDGEGDHYIICSPKPLTDLAAENALVAWAEECEKG